MGLDLTAGNPTTPTFTGLVTANGGIAQPNPAAAAGRGQEVQLTQWIGLDLNTVAATTLVTFPASGMTRAVVTRIILENYSIAATTASVSWGASGTPTDWQATATNANAATNRMLIINPSATAATYAPGVNFVANVTIAQGAAATVDVRVFGYYR